MLLATIGAVGNSDHMNIVIGKAGRNRWKGIRPTVRGTAMNPIDHPHGGGEGRTKGGRHPVSPTGKLAKGGPDAVDGGAWNRLYVFQRYTSIGAGTSEVQKNIIAKRAIDMPER